MSINWLHVSLAALAVYAGILGFFLAKRRWTAGGLGVALANMLFVLVNLAAPFRGALDPSYAGYSLGLIRVGPGIGVTVASGSIVILALASACLAVLGLRGRAMAFVAAVDGALLLLVGLPVVFEGLANSAAYTIELGEYLVIPGMVAVLLSALLFMAPLVASIVWSGRRIRAA
jgi:hypothetical protein